MKTLKSFTALMIALAVPAFLGGAPAAEKVVYGTYINQKHSFEVKYPKELVSPKPAGLTGEGRTFESEDTQVKMRVWGEANDANRSWKDEYEWTLGNMVGDEVTNKAFKPGVFAISGRRLDNIFYRKEMLVKEGEVEFFLIFEIEYHKSYASTWNAITLTCAKSFKLTKCEGLPADDIFK